MEELKNSDKASPSDLVGKYSRLSEEVPFIGPIPPDLKDVPENVARICLKQREVMDSPANKYIISYGSFQYIIPFFFVCC